MSLLRRVAAAISRRTKRFHPSVIAQKKRMDRETERLLSEVETRGFEESPSFKSYLFAQIRRSLPISKPDPTQPVIARTEYLTQLMRTHIPEAGRIGAKVLCVGCRDGRELNAILDVTSDGKGSKKGDITGLDLFSQDPRIQVGDMHQMPFEDESFDILYSCHNLEHAYDLQRAVNEFRRVVRPGGWLMIEVPVRFEPTATDRQDVGSIQGLIDYFSPSIAEVLFSEESSRVVRGYEKSSARMLARVRDQNAGEGAENEESTP